MPKSIHHKPTLSLPLFDAEKARSGLLTTYQKICLEILLVKRTASPQELQGLLPWPHVVLFFMEQCQTTDQQKGMKETVLQLVNKLLVLNNDDTLAYDILSYVSMPGVNYFSVLKFIHEHAVPRTYLEIGMHTGDSIRLCGPKTQAFGVDPVITPTLRDNCPENVSLYKMTSDAFFDQIDLVSLLNGQPLDMAFINGLHLFDFALRDFINIERYCHQNSFVFFHDTYPLEPTITFRERLTDFYIGDVWKILPCLKKYRPDLQINTIMTRPSGLTVVRNLDPDNRVLVDNLKEIYDEFVFLEYSHFLKSLQDGIMNLVPIDPNWILNDLLEGGCYQ